jgi:UDP-N-acetylmuramate dehydrogenase
MFQSDYPLQLLNTFGMDVRAEKFASFDSVPALQALLPAMQTEPVSTRSSLILGGGSNVLFTRDVAGFVLHNNIRGIQVVGEDETQVFVQAGAGENWHQFVLHCIDQQLAGVENLALIPGRVGASPMQNIGAYGVEIKDVFHSLEAIHRESGEQVIFSGADCSFGYRESVFKNKFKNQFVITSVTYALRKQPQFQISYGAIQQELDRMGVTTLSIQAVAEAVMHIRQSKLPDPAVTGNAGSFFKNPEVPVTQFELLKEQFPNMVGYPVSDASVKLAAGWLIEQCGWKGFRRGDAGCHDKQALVLVNYGCASGSDIWQLSQEIIQSVKDKFQVTLVPEVNVY